MRDGKGFPRLRTQCHAAVQTNGVDGTDLGVRDIFAGVEPIAVIGDVITNGGETNQVVEKRRSGSELCRLSGMSMSSSPVSCHLNLTESGVSGQPLSRGPSLILPVAVSNSLEGRI